MMVAESDVDQFSLFPEANAADIVRTRYLLSRYMKLKADVEGFETNNLSEGSEILKEAIKVKSNIEKAADLIIDNDTRRIIDFRFLKGNNRKTTILRFKSIMSESTIDRYIEKGIESIAQTFKLWDEFESYKSC
ncbi:hypothetical protein QFZ77_005439 [Paenibacillus sp. V4I3]|uniref:hypothetical protein n=1 Tax=Paenibacillus sp. V4I3 TaxID=3042305 RepID=UPI00277D47B6|nr:hypothetical protein [Paenibacillus sp. V4I3]MDQ0876780.1 hypothetical protein [Paenibacillus sp. V4I3]